MAAGPDLYTHPADRNALAQLKKIPLFDSCVKAYMKLFPERLLHGLNMATKVRVTAKQLPKIYKHLPPVCEALKIEEPELYLEMDPRPNAYTYGDKRVYITVTSGLIENLNEHEVQTVIAHECGHIACQHVLYHTMAQLLIQVGPAIFGPLAALSLPVRMALMYWVRCSELSSDRASAVVMQGSKPVIEVMVRLAGGSKEITEDIDLQLYAQQAAAYDELMKSKWDQILQTLVTIPQTHPFFAVRVREIMRWCKTDEFKTAARQARTKIVAAKIKA